MLEAEKNAPVSTPAAGFGVQPVNPNRALWEKGDFTRIAATMRESGEELVLSLGIKPGAKVLDLGCGDGTTAIPAARRGADVLGVDIASNLVQAGNARGREAGLYNVRFQEGDASNLAGIASSSFDLVISIFGAMFAPRPFDVAREMVRVTKPGGRIVMGNWIPGDPTLVAQILKISAAYTPPAFRSGRHRRGQHPLRTRDLVLPSAGAAFGPRRHVPPLLRPDDERLRGSGEGRPCRGAEPGADRSVRGPEPRRRKHRDSRDLPEGHRQQGVRSQQVPDPFPGAPTPSTAVRPGHHFLGDER
jgi:SAM-dependent methyltransferase